jgi:predicted PurR-regulated permease PerM
VAGGYHAAIPCTVSCSRSTRAVATDRHLSFDLSWRTIIRVLLTLVIIWLALELWTLVMVILVSIIIAVALDPIVRWTETLHFPRWVGSSLSVLLLVVAAAAMLMVGWTTISAQARFILDHLEAFDRQIRATFPLLQQVLPNNPKDATSWLGRYAGTVAASAVRAAMLVTIGLILTVYLLIEWKQTFEWVLAFFSPKLRAKVRRTAIEARETVFGYVVGNVVTSIFATAVVFVGLMFLHVPAALVLSLLAGVFDFVPVLGFVLSGVPAVILAATVSMTTVLLVLALYVSYHFIENYVIAPRVYGGRLAMSNLAVLLAFAVGAELGGVIGALIALPIAATYPAIERIWLREYLSEETVVRHERLTLPIK